MLRLWPLLVLAGCAGEPDRLFGEVHVHQFPGGAHLAATFLARSVAAATVEKDSVVPDTSKVLLREGACRVIGPSPCEPPCGVPLEVVDAGPVHIGGGLASLSLVYVAGIYRVEPQTGMVPPVFAGGEPLSITGDGFDGELRAPVAIEISASAALDSVSWAPSTATRVDVTFVVSRSDGPWAIVRCSARDQDGAWSLPPSLVALLPPPPRDLQLVVERNAILRVPGPNGAGVILHASWEDKLSAHQD